MTLSGIWLNLFHTANNMIKTCWLRDFVAATPQFPKPTICSIYQYCGNLPDHAGINIIDDLHMDNGQVVDVEHWGLVDGWKDPVVGFASQGLSLVLDLRSEEQRAKGIFYLNY